MAANRPTGPTRRPERAPLVLGSLILVAGIANLNLMVANVALPDIGRSFDASQTGLNLVAAGYSLGLAGSVLYLGALGDRYGRKAMLLAGMGLSIPASIMAAWAPSIAVLFGARVFGGVAAGMAFPTTLALITALWSPSVRTRPIALWSGAGGALAALGPLLAGGLLEHFWWGSVFVVTGPIATLALVTALVIVPSHVGESTGRVDNIGGVLSAVTVGALILAINFSSVPGELATAVVLGVVALAVGVAFVLRQRGAANPLFDLHIASRRVFWVAALGGIIVFGALMGAMFIGQQFLQNVLAYSPLESGAAILPAAVMMVIIAPRSARLVEARGARFTLLTGYSFCLAGFVTMLVAWTDHSSYLPVGLAYALIGAGIGFAGTPASHSLTSAVPVRRAGMASATADLQRDFGGAIMQSLLGALLTAGYAGAFTKLIAGSPGASDISNSVEAQLTKSFSGAADTAEQYPQYAQEIVTAARTSFVDGADWAYGAGILAIVAGATLVFFLFPKRDAEVAALARYGEQDARENEPTEGN